MNTFSKAAIRNVLIAAGLTAGFGAVNVYAAEESGAPQPHSDGLSATISDTTITAKVKTKLMGEDSLKGSEVHVTTTNGVVTLDGTVLNKNAKDAASNAAQSVEGVRSVDNDLVVPGASKTVAKTKQTASDSWITTKVKSELLADSVSKGLDIKVETKGGVVILTGILATEDAIKHVKDIAAKVEGVKSVDISGLFVSAS
ncbi:MAG TPA: BON domain-containing protein [Spongiibacteraceae bacterium]|nr:BON domain-containing protein [Spongiibacteraceae bacterium]